MGLGIIGGLNQASAQKHALAAQQRMADMKAQRERIQQIRESRIKRAQIEQSAANTGAADSSSAQAGAGAVESQLAGNIGYLNEQQGQAKLVTHYEVDQINAKGLQSIGEGLQSMGSKMMSAGGS